MDKAIERLRLKLSESDLRWLGCTDEEEILDTVEMILECNKNESEVLKDFKRIYRLVESLSDKEFNLIPFELVAILNTWSGSIVLDESEDD